MIYRFLESCPAAVQELKFMKKKDQQSGRKATPILIAAKMGVTEMVEKILDTFPEAIHDLDSEKKNLVLLAVENRQTGIYKLLLDRKMLGESDLSIFQHVDIKGNSALHLAAKFGEYGPWRIPGAALQMQWEIKWYKVHMFPVDSNSPQPQALVQFLSLIIIYFGHHSLSRNLCRDISFLDTTTKAKHQRKSSQKHTKNLSKMARNGCQEPPSHA